MGFYPPPPLSGLTTNENPLFMCIFPNSLPLFNEHVHSTGTVSGFQPEGGDILITKDEEVAKSTRRTLLKYHSLLGALDL